MAAGRVRDGQLEDVQENGLQLSGPDRIEAIAEREFHVFEVSIG
jgi:hypothetical protein